ncbi:class I SAM-dependent methyltransferase [Thiocapsa rosea]|uniref:Methyltransferase family protein n=1 Tax=Thiocapsa rosea TaxID=69360 RepID=A0A495VEZ4_9GAMM|nr:class I SAM-dependent methyltransferase [Thiocapsa rosea]RKT47410.1 methyltransferase family protein [Thiocapsa rosea]
MREVSVSVLVDRVKGRLRRLLKRPHRRVDLGDLRRTEPFCRRYGFSRGLAVDRRYIEDFIETQQASITGRVLEVLNNNYTLRFGGDRVTRSDVLDINPANPSATIRDDLRSLSTIPDEVFDCVILTQTLHLIDDDNAAIRQVYRILKPGGALLLTVPCISKVGMHPDDCTWYRFYTDAGIRYLLERTFQPSMLSVESHGNVLTAAAYLYGLAVRDLESEYFEVNDPEYSLIVAVAARKQSS